MVDFDDMITTLESFKLGMISQATGGSYDANEYKEIRTYLLSKQELNHLIPQFIRTCRSLIDFWPYIKEKSGTYAGRRAFLADELNPLLDFYEEIKIKKDTISINTDSYALGDEIGRGGYGRVYKYWHKQLEINFAIKFLSPIFVPAEERVEYNNRFFREAKMLFNLNHKNIVRFYDTGIIGTTPFIKMEYIEGYNIYEVMKKYGVIRFEKSITPVTHILDGLSHANSLGCIHRDIKPSNILFDIPSKLFKIIDFGIGAYIEHELHTKLTRTGEGVVGDTYTAPELIDNPHLKDKRSDIYSVGAIWYHLLTGATPKGSGLDTVLSERGLKEQQVKIVLKCLAPIDKRFSSCDEVLEEIQNLR